RLPSRRGRRPARRAAPPACGHVGAAPRRAGRAPRAHDLGHGADRIEVMVGEEQTFAGWPFVTAQIAAVSEFAVPITPRATALPGSRGALAIESRLLPCRTAGS